MLRKNAHIVLCLDGQDACRDLAEAKELGGLVINKIEENMDKTLIWSVTSFYPPFIGGVSSLGLEVDRELIDSFLAQVDISVLNDFVLYMPKDMRQNIKRRRCKKGQEKDLFEAIFKSVLRDV